MASDEILKNIKVPVFNVQSFSLHDGPGIRTTVFLKGCPLRCLWCHNPESQKRNAELFVYREKCSGCGRCMQMCPQKAILLSGGKYITDRTLCTGCGKCTEICPENAREITGKNKTVEELMQLILKDRMFYDASGGGVTISGGEPLLYPGFVRELTTRCTLEKIHTAVETCGYADIPIVHHALETVDLVLFDIKALDEELHRRLTGVSNKKILESAAYIYHKMKKPMVIRIPVIPGYNDSKENIDQVCAYVRDVLDPGVKIHLLPYHNLGQDKEERLEWNVKHKFYVPTDEKMEQIQKQMTQYGLDVQIGGSM